MPLLNRNDTKPQDFAYCLLMCAALLCIPVVPVLLSSEQRTDPTRFAPVRPMLKEEFGKADPKRIGEIVPAIKSTACLFSQKAVRHHLSPAKVGLAACGTPGMQITISDDLIDMTVSGAVEVDGLQRPFSVILQHNPPSASEDSLIIVAVKVR